MGGIGKTLLATAVGHDPDVRHRFTDGVFWLTVGQDPRLTALQQQLAADLGDERPIFDDPEAGKRRLRELLACRRCLPILDDVWQAEAALAFPAPGGEGRLLFTTRDGGVLTDVQADEYRLDVLEEAQALQMLARYTGQETAELPSKAHEVMRQCGWLPLALAVCGAMVRDGTGWGDLLEALRDADLSYLDRKVVNYAHQLILKSLQVSVEALERDDPKGARCYKALAVFRADESVPEAAVRTLWEHLAHLKPRGVGKLLGRLERKSLLRLDGAEPVRTVALHDLQHDYLRDS